MLEGIDRLRHILETRNNQKDSHDFALVHHDFSFFTFSLPFPFRLHREPGVQDDHKTGVGERDGIIAHCTQEEHMGIRIAATLSASDPTFSDIGADDLAYFFTLEFSLDGAAGV